MLKPIGVSEHRLTELLPTTQQLEEKLNALEAEKENELP